MESKICTKCNNEESNEELYDKYTECKTCNTIRSLKHYYGNKDKLSNQRKIYHENKRDLLLAQSIVKQHKRKTCERLKEELSKKLEGLTQAIETLKTSNS